MFIGEKLLEGYLKRGLQDILDNEPLGDAALSSLPEDERQRGLQWLNETLEQNKLTITQGYSRRPPTMPFISILVGNETETNQPIGLVGIATTPSGSTAEWDGVFFQTTYRLLMMNANANALTYLSHFVKFTLLRYRSNLTQDGLYEQVLGVSDLLPAEEFSNPEVEVFQRGITLTGTHFAEFPVGITKTSTSVTITPTFETQIDGIDLLEIEPTVSIPA